MSPSEMQFKVRAVPFEGGGTDDATSLKVFDGFDRLVGTGKGAVELSLPKGLITVQAERLGAIKNQTFAHAADSDLNPHEFVVKRRNSAMPTEDTAHTHEFFQQASQQYSSEPTWPPNAGGPDGDGRLMILVRSSGAGDSAEVFPSKTLTLFDDSGAVVTQFEPAKTARHQHQGWVAFSANLAPGGYILADTHAASTRSLPIAVFDGWSTLLFVPYETRPRLEGSSISIISKHDTFDPSNTLTQHVDASIQGLGQRLNLLDDRLANEALYGKFDYPLLGLIGAYSHFLGEKRKDRLERQVLHNMWRLLPGSVDVLAVLLLALEREGDLPNTMDALKDAGNQTFGHGWFDVMQFPLQFPPMMRPGLNALNRASRHLPDLIAPDSWIEAAALSSYAEGAWAIWEQRGGLETAVAPKATVPKPKARKKRRGPLSRQRLYPLLRMAAKTAARSASRTVKATDRIGTLVQDNDTLTNTLGGLINTMNDNLPDVALTVDPSVVREDERVRDLVRRIQKSAQALAEHPIRLKPQTKVPDWLVSMVQRELSEKADSFDLTGIAERADVPLRAVRAAMAKLGK